MSSDQQVILGLVVFIAAVMTCGWLAERKGYNPTPYVLGALIVWPVPLLILLLKPKNPKLFRRCADCGSTDVPFDVPVCKHCGRDERTAVTS